MRTTKDKKKLLELDIANIKLCIEKHCYLKDRKELLQFLFVDGVSVDREKFVEKQNLNWLLTLHHSHCEIKFKAEWDGSYLESINTDKMELDRLNSVLESLYLELAMIGLHVKKGKKACKSL